MYSVNNSCADDQSCGPAYNIGATKYRSSIRMTIFGHIYILRHVRTLHLAICEQLSSFTEIKIVAICKRDLQCRHTSSFQQCVYRYWRQCAKVQFLKAKAAAGQSNASCSSGLAASAATPTCSPIFTRCWSLGKKKRVFYCLVWTWHGGTRRRANIFCIDRERAQGVSMTPPPLPSPTAYTLWPRNKGVEEQASWNIFSLFRPQVQIFLFDKGGINKNFSFKSFILQG